MKRLLLTLPLLFGPLLFGPLLFGLAACGDTAPEPTYQPADYSYLPKIKLNVASIEINDSWAPHGTRGHIEQLAPLQPRDALTRMATDRLLTGGNSGTATFETTDATILRASSTYDAHFAVRVRFTNDNGDILGDVAAEVARHAPAQDDTEATTRIALDNLVRATMADMNVELEYQLRRKTKDLLQSTSPAAPEPEQVQSEDLGTPGKPVGVLKPAP